MISQFSNQIKPSFFFWAENAVLNEAQAYYNYTSKLYYKADSSIDSNYLSYSSPFKQWVYDKGVSGAFICESVSGDVTLNRASGIKIDYENGRVLVPSGFGQNLNISGTYAFKEFNFYLSNENEESLIANEKYYLNSKFNRKPVSGIEPYAMVTPAFFVNILSNLNEPFALGGQKKTVVGLSMVAFADTMDQLDSAISFFVDKKHKYIPIYTTDPINSFGDVKTGLYPSGYNFSTIKSENGQPGNLIYIEDVRGSKLSDSPSSDLKKSFVGIIDFELSRERYS
jgi:hypothetical protein